MMLIRRATIDDVPALVSLAKLEHGLSRMAHTPFDHAFASERFTGAVLGLSSAVFVSETDGEVTGLIAGAVQQNLHNRYCTAYELLWFAVDGSGLKLLEALRTWARRMRAVALVANNHAGIKDPERFNKVMARKGYAQLGTSFMAQL